MIRLSLGESLLKAPRVLGCRVPLKEGFQDFRASHCGEGIGSTRVSQGTRRGPLALTLLNTEHSWPKLSPTTALEREIIHFPVDRTACVCAAAPGDASPGTDGNSRGRHNSGGTTLTPDIRHACLLYTSPSPR